MALVDLGLTLVHVLFLGIFLFAFSVQFNDPDPQV